MCNSYMHILKQPVDKINGEIFNVGFENYSVSELALLVKEAMPFKVDVEKVPTDDNRSYHIPSDKIKKKIGFNNKKTIKDAIDELVYAFKKNFFLKPLSNEMYFNINRMKSINLK